MSVWATILDLEDNPPYMYPGSHVLPSEDDPRDEGWAVQLAQIPSHITRDGRDDQPEDGVPWPWLRLSVNQADVVLDREQVRGVWESMGAWLEQTGPVSYPLYASLRAQLEAEYRKLSACAEQDPKPGAGEARVAQQGMAEGVLTSLAWVIHHFEGPQARAAFLEEVRGR